MSFRGRTEQFAGLSLELSWWFYCKKTKSKGNATNQQRTHRNESQGQRLSLIQADNVWIKPLVNRLSPLSFFVMWHTISPSVIRAFCLVFRSLLLQSSFSGPGRPRGISLSSGSVCVPRSLMGKFPPGSVIDSIFWLRHLRICAGLNEVWLPTTTQEFKHTWDTRKGWRQGGTGAHVGGLGRDASRDASGDGERSKVRGEHDGDDTVTFMWTEKLREENPDRWMS